MKADNSNIEAYIEYVVQEPKISILLSYIWVMCIVGLPTATSGSYSNITKIVMLPIMGTFGAWIAYLIINIKRNVMQMYNLFLGLYCIFISISLILAAYKIALTVGKVSAPTILIVIICYVIFIIINLYNTLRLIRNGYYNNKSKNNNFTGIMPILIIFSICLVLGKISHNTLSQSIVVNILILSLLFMSFLLSVGTLNLLKFYFGKAGY